MVARIGGDEFLIIFPECDALSASEKIRDIQKCLIRIELRENKPFPLRFSFGVVSFFPDSMKTSEELLNEADKLMYKNKKDRLASR